MSVEADLDAWTIAEAGRRLRARELSATELTRAALERIGARNAALNAFITVASDDALRAAAAADARLAAGTAAGPLDGIPVAVKDVIATACVRTTAARTARSTSGCMPSTKYSRGIAIRRPSTPARSAGV